MFKFKNIIKAPKSLFFKATIIFLFFFSLFLSGHLLHNEFTTSDDPYYHAKHALLIEQSGKFNLVEPWLKFQFFNYAPTDPWWGFHFGMAIFIHWFGLFLGVKIFVSLLAALIFLVFYLILTKLDIKYSSVWTFLLFFSSPILTSRLFFERPHLLSLIVMPLAFLFLVKNKNFWLFVISLFYALCYDLAPLIIFQTFIYLLADFYINRKINLRPLIASAGGILVGILVHPSSLNYCYIIILQLWQTFFLKFTGVDLNIGSESQPMSFSYFLKGNLLVLIPYILSTVLFLSFKRVNKSVISIFLFLYSSLWFLVTLLVPRGVEYWLPGTFIFAAFVSKDFLATEEFKQIKNWLANKINFKIISFFLISLLILNIFNNLSRVFFNLYYNNTKVISENYQQANEWLKKNTPAGSMVFYNNWGMWPMMFYYNDHNRYIVGIDPTFLYEYDHKLFWIWHNISSHGLYCDRQEACFDISPRDNTKLVKLAIKEKFQANYILLLNEKDQPLIKFLSASKRDFINVFNNGKILVYQLK